MQGITDAYRAARRAFAKWATGWAMEDNISPPQGPPDSQEVIRVLHALGYHIRYIELSSARDFTPIRAEDGKDRNGCRIVVSCTTSGLRTVLEAPVSKCTCPDFDQETTENSNRTAIQIEPVDEKVSFLLRDVILSLADCTLAEGIESLASTSAEHSDQGIFSCPTSPMHKDSLRFKAEESSALGMSTPERSPSFGTSDNDIIIGDKILTAISFLQEVFILNHIRRSAKSSLAEVSTSSLNSKFKSPKAPPVRKLGTPTTSSTATTSAIPRSKRQVSGTRPSTPYPCMPAERPEVTTPAKRAANPRAQYGSSAYLQERKRFVQKKTPKM